MLISGSEISEGNDTVSQKDSLLEDVSLVVDGFEHESAPELFAYFGKSCVHRVV